MQALGCRIALDSVTRMMPAANPAIYRRFY